MSKVYDKAVAAWWKVNQTHLNRVLPWFVENGVVVSTPELFLMARPWAVGCDVYEYVPEPDTWLILLAASSKAIALRQFMKLAPYPLPNLAWHRKEKLKIWSWDQVKRHLYEHESSGTTGAELRARDARQFECADRPVA